MRDIRFRAWQTATKTMFHNIEKGTGAPDGNPPFADYLENDHMIVMQFTGLKDHKGKEIYEGDIIKVTGLYSDEQYAKVIWGPVSNMYTWMNGETWLLHFASDVEGPLYPYCQRSHGYDVSVVGNIYEQGKEEV